MHDRYAHRDTLLNEVILATGVRLKAIARIVGYTENYISHLRYLTHDTTPKAHDQILKDILPMLEERQAKIALLLERIRQLP